MGEKDRLNPRRRAVHRLLWLLTGGYPGVEERVSLTLGCAASCLTAVTSMWYREARSNLTYVWPVL